MWDLSCPTRDWTQPTVVEAQSLDHWTARLPYLQHLEQQNCAKWMISHPQEQTQMTPWHMLKLQPKPKLLKGRIWSNLTLIKLVWRPWCWERLKAGGEGDDRGWDGWMASLTQWTWVWASSGRWWRTGKPGVLQPMGSQRVRHDWATEQKQPPWTYNQIFPCLLSTWAMFNWVAYDNICFKKAFTISMLTYFGFVDWFSWFKI